MYTAIMLRCSLDQKSIPQYVVVDDPNALPPLFRLLEFSLVLSLSIFLLTSEVRSPLEVTSEITNNKRMWLWHRFRWE
jgi:hypothetical protein